MQANRSTPTQEICINEKFNTTYYDKNLHLFVEKWNGYAPSAQMRRVSEDLIEAIKAKKCGKILNDFSNGQVVSPDDQKWVNDVWFPRAIKAGMTHMAFVLTESYFNKITVQAIMEKVTYPGFEFEYFGNFDKAMEWLKNAK